MLVSLSGVCKNFGIDVVLEDVSLRIDSREKIALVGRNGTGKTTLLKLLCGEMEPDGGTVSLARGVRIGRLDQESPVAPGRTILEEVESGLSHQKELRDRLADLEKRLEDGPTQDDLDEYALVHEHFLEEEGYSLDHDVRTVLLRTGFEEGEFDKRTDDLSGGEKTRLALARILLEEPDLLVLDEPTNHLDLQATEWLESWINNYHGAVLTVSHDREFLQKTAQRVIELRGHRLESFQGGFDKYLVLRKERDEDLAKASKKQDDQIAKLDEYVRRFMNSQRTAQARGRLKQMERLKANRVSTPKKERGMAASIRPTKRSGDIVVECKSLGVGYPGLDLIEGFDWIVRWGDRWGVIGENGAGKSSLARTALGMQEPTSGSRRLGSRVEVGYFAQDATGLDLELSPLQFVSYECGLDAGPARDLLGRFLIEGDDVFRPIRTLSGGEKNKLALARLCAISPNLLVLDEPTNHLDMASREALAEVLDDYTGTLVLISHDRWLLRRCARSIVDVRRGGTVLFPGTYDEYRQSVKTGPTTSSPRKGDAVPKLSARELSKEIERAKVALSEAEETVTKMEARVAEIERSLASPEPDADIVAKTIEHTKAIAVLKDAMHEWEQAATRLEELKAAQG